ncbi:MAG: exopolysaccharide biosynthesis protein [Chthoniobacteraceae bacterium]
MSAAPDTEHPTPAEEVLEPVSADLRSLLDVANGQPMSLGEIEAHLRERGYALLVLFLAAPFLIPSIPGLSVPFGLAIMLIGVAFILRRRPRIPGFILQKKMEFSTLQKVIPFVARLMERLERHMRPRLKFLVAGPVMTGLLGAGIVSGGFFLALPLPLPLTNTLPALSIIFLITGTLCRDGLMILAGHLTGLAAWAYLAVWIYFGARMLPWLRSLWDSARHWF